MVGLVWGVFNDVAIAIRDLQDKQPNIKIMVVDTDAHQGNGTAARSFQEVEAPSRYCMTTHAV